MPSHIASSSLTSPSTTPAPRARSASAEAAERARARTVSPRAAGASTRLRPRKPEPPVTKACIGAPLRALRPLGAFEGAAARDVELLAQRRLQPAHGNAHLLHGVALANGHRLVLQGVEVDGDGERRADLVLAAVAAADRLGLVVRGGEAAAQVVLDAVSHLAQLGLLAERQDGDLEGRDVGMHAQHHALLAAHLLAVVGVDHHRDHAAVDRRGRLDDVGQVALVAHRVQVGLVPAAVLLVAREVVVGAVGDAAQLSPAEGEEVLDVEGALAVVRPLLGRMLVHAQAAGAQAEVLDVPGPPLALPVVEPLVVGPRLAEELHLHDLELADPEDEVAGGDLVAERLADLGDAEGHPRARRVDHLLEVDEHPLGRLRAQPDLGGCVLDRAGEGLEHEVEVARLGERAVALGAEPLRGVLASDAALLFEMVLAPAAAALPGAVDQRVGEVLHVAAGLPDAGVHDDRGLDRLHVVAQLDHPPPPGVADVAAQPGAQRAEVVQRVDAAVDLARLEDEAALLAQRDQLLDDVGGRRRGLGGGGGGVGGGHGGLRSLAGAGAPAAGPRGPGRARLWHHPATVKERVRRWSGVVFRPVAVAFDPRLEGLEHRVVERVLGRLDALERHVATDADTAAEMGITQSRLLARLEARLAALESAGSGSGAALVSSSHPVAVAWALGVLAGLPPPARIALSAPGDPGLPLALVGLGHVVSLVDDAALPEHPRLRRDTEESGELDAAVVLCAEGPDGPVAVDAALGARLARRLRLGGTLLVSTPQ